ncbi:hypothetical protein RCL1_001532 [Eukaryota sp. TZLM3-RCL]
MSHPPSKKQRVEEPDTDSSDDEDFQMDSDGETMELNENQQLLDITDALDEVESLDEAIAKLRDEIKRIENLKKEGYKVVAAFSDGVCVIEK